MKRRLFKFAATLSLLLCLATVGLWIISYRTTFAVAEIRNLPVEAQYEQFKPVATDRMTMLRSWRGSISIMRNYRATGVLADPAGWTFITAPSQTVIPHERPWSWIRFAFRTETQATTIKIPHQTHRGINTVQYRSNHVTVNSGPLGRRLRMLTLPASFLAITARGIIGRALNAVARLRSIWSVPRWCGRPSE